MPRPFLHYPIENIEEHPHLYMIIEGDIPRFSWFDYRMPNVRRSVTWWILFCIAMSGFAFGAAYYGSYIIAFTFVLLAFIYFASNVKPEQPIPITISDMGIYYNETFFSYQDIECFWIEHPFPDMNILHFRPKKDGNMLVSTRQIIMAEQDVLEIRNFLLEQMPEHEDPPIDVSQRIFWRIWL